MAITDINVDVTECIKGINASMLLDIVNAYDSSVWNVVNGMTMIPVQRICDSMRESTEFEIKHILKMERYNEIFRND